MTRQVTADAAGGPLRELASALRPRGIGRLVARTAGYNVTSAAAAGLGGIIVARALGPEMRGEYAAVTAWFGVALMVGGMGQPAALCFHVAHDPGNARGLRRDVPGDDAGDRHGRAGRGHPAGSAPRPGERGADRCLPDRLRRLDRGVRRGQLHVLAAGQEPTLVERGAGDPAGSEPGAPRRACGGCGCSRWRPRWSCWPSPCSSSSAGPTTAAGRPAWHPAGLRPGSSGPWPGTAWPRSRP